jgi:hypothetical protein
MIQILVLSIVWDTATCHARHSTSGVVRRVTVDAYGYNSFTCILRTLMYYPY